MAAFSEPVRNPVTTHTCFQHLPLVDISGLYAPDLPTRQATARALGQAAHEAGFLYITGHPLQPANFQSLVDITRAYFNQPLDRKMQDYIGQSSNHSGYVPMGEEQFASGSIDHKEAYDIGYDYLAEQDRRPMLGATQWPDFPGFKSTVQAYYREALQLGNTLFRGFALALGLDEDYFETITLNPPSQLRLIHYPFNLAASDKPGIGAHTDYECFTILFPTQDGLEVMNGAGDWIDAPVIEGALVVNIGDMMEILSNGYFMATSHRVRKVQQERYSFPLFCACDYDTLIQPIAGLKPHRADKLYQPLYCGDHLYAQTIQTFAYLKKRLAEGQIRLPQNSQALSSFGHLTQS